MPEGPERSRCGSITVTGGRTVKAKLLLTG